MSKLPFDQLPLICPIDGLALSRDERSFRCDNNHSYDLARQGYLHLLPVQFKASKAPGDTKEMVEARRRVLEAGLFDPLAKAVSDLLAELFAKHHIASTEDVTTLVDAGCGEGYYTAFIHRELLSRVANCATLGIDIAKPAIHAAAVKYKDISWVVGSNIRLPIMPKKADVITCLFGFPAWEHWAEWQNAGQIVVVVDPAEQHLIELRNLIYKEPRQHAAPAHQDAVKAGYECIYEQACRFEINASSSSLISDIMLMTPHGQRAGQAGRAAVGGLGSLTMIGDVLVRVYRRG